MKKFPCFNFTPKTERLFLVSAIIISGLWFYFLNYFSKNTGINRLTIVISLVCLGFFLLSLWLFRKTDKKKLKISVFLWPILPLLFCLVLKMTKLDNIGAINISLYQNRQIFYLVGFLLSFCLWFGALLDFSKLLFFEKIGSRKIIIFSVLFFALLYLLITLQLYLKFNTYAFDLGIYDQKVWRYSQFLPPYNSILGMNNFADHFEPILAVVALLYRIWNNVVMLLIFEAVIVALGFIPVFLIAKKYLKSNLSALFISYGYLLSMGILQAVHYPAHPGTWLPTFYAFAIYFVIEKKYYLYFLCLILALMSKESAFIHVAFIGLFVLIQFKDRLVGWLTILLSVISYILIFKVVFFIANGGQAYAHGIFSNISNDPVQFLKFIILHPVEAIKIAFSPSIKAQTLFLTLGSAGFLSIFTPVFLLLVLPFLVERLLTNHPGMITMSFHYSAPIMAIVFISAIFFLCRLVQKGHQKIVPVLSVFLFLCSVSLMMVSSSYISPLYALAKSQNYSFGDREKEALDIIKKVPNNASVISEDAFVTHLSHRQEIGLFGNNQTEKYEYILLAKTDEYSCWPAQFTDVYSEIANLRSDKSYVITAENDRLVLFRKVKDD